MAHSFRLLPLEARAVKKQWTAAIALGLLAGAAPLRAGTGERGGAVPRAAPPPRVEAAEVTGVTAIRLDGDFGEAVWARAVPVTAFVQRDPREGAPPSFGSEARVAYDTSYLYVAVRAFDSDTGRIVGIRTRRDSPSPSDWIRVVIDSYHDRRTAYEFAVNPAGVKQDRYWFADGNSDQSWDAVWDVSVSRDADGWRAEFRIPFSQLRFETGKRDTFGFGVIREIGRLNETSSWPLIAKSRTGFVSQLGELGGLQLAGGLKRLEVVPYGVAQVSTRQHEAENPFDRSPDPGGSAGADIKFALTPGLTMTATINPDFGQVEADPAVVNLTAFETFYPERRPFFVESSGNLKFDLDCNDGACTGLFYSRRIGRQPHGSPDIPPGGFASVPLQTTIIGAAKLTGRAGAFSIGALNAVTAEEQASLSFGSRSAAETVEPLTNYAVVQAKREWSNQSSLGFMFTNTARRLTTDVDYLPSTATTGGVTWDWRLKDPRYSVTGYWSGSTVQGSADAIDALQRSPVHYFQRPDAGHLVYDPAATSMSGHAGMVGVQKVGGQKVRFSFAGNYKTPGFDVNDVGYLRRADAIQQSGWVQFRWDTPTKLYRSVRLNLNQWAGWNFDGDTRFTGANVNAHITLPSNWSAGTGFNAEGAGIDDRSTRGGPAFRSKSGANVWYYVQSDSRKSVNGGWMGFYFRDETGSSAWRADPRIEWRPTSFLALSLGVGFETMNEDTQWVDNVAGASSTHYVFGRIQQSTVSLPTRIDYTITPTLSVQIYAEPFVSAGSYSDFKELARPRATPFASQFDAVAYPGNPDFNYKSFRSTNVLRWEFKPGSAVYVVWQQGREDASGIGRFRFRQDVGSLFGIPASNVFLVKFSYWLNL
jgi:Domain of unknown function (DUF5916)